MQNLRHIFPPSNPENLLPQLNLKFEIEVLCKNLSLDINDLKPGTLLKDKDKLKSLEEQLSAPKKEAKPPEELLPVSTTGGSTALKYFLLGVGLGINPQKNFFETMHFFLIPAVENECIAVS